jgi:ATP-dependent 26S proteasome regulatory subunit
VEDYAGLMILASNYKNNLDESFLRRFTLIHFPMPNSADRLLLWKKSMPARLGQDASVNLEELSQYELSGASILNAIQYAALRSYVRKDDIILQSDLVKGIQREYLKEDKSF